MRRTTVLNVCYFLSLSNFYILFSLLVGKETLELLRYIFNVVNEDHAETSQSGLTQVSLKKFLFILLICAGMYLFCIWFLFSFYFDVMNIP